MKNSLIVPLILLTAAFSIAAESAPSSSPRNLLRELNDSFAGVFEKTAPAVVVVESRGQPSNSRMGYTFRGPGGAPYRLIPDLTGDDLLDMPPGIGSGFVFTTDGHILTNYHVIDGASDIRVRLHDGRRFPAMLVGSDERSDIAVLKIEADNLVPAELANSDLVKVGSFAFAIGSPMELPHTFTFGIVSAKGRTLGLGGHYDEFLQTDTSINPGNSGGPLCDIDGRVIGINTLISGNSNGVGFAIPSNTARDIASQLITKGRVSRPWLGISIATLEEMRQLRSLFPGIESGVVVRGIEPGAPAQMSDLNPGDVITKVDGTPVSLASDLQREILGKKIGQTVELEIWRKGRTLRLGVKTGESPDKFVRASTRPPTTPRTTPQPQTTPASPSSPGFSYETATPETLQTMGIQNKTPKGVIVTAVEPYSAAAASGLERGDIITEAGGLQISSREDLDKALQEIDRDRGILLLLDRAAASSFAILKF